MKIKNSFGKQKFLNICEKQLKKKGSTTIKIY